jgi:hypothetical protein
VSVLIVVLSLATGLLVAVRYSWRGYTRALAALAVLCVVWLVVDKAFEGRVLLTIAAAHGDHGVVAADLVAVLAGVAGLFGWLRHRRLSAGSRLLPTGRGSDRV